MNIKYKFNESGRIKEIEVDVSDKVALALGDLVREEEKLNKRDQRHLDKNRMDERFDYKINKSPEDLLIYQETVEKLNEALSKLTETEQRRIIAYFYNRLTYDRIAKKENHKYSSVYESVQGALKKMKKYFNSF